MDLICRICLASEKNNQELTKIFGNKVNFGLNIYLIAQIKVLELNNIPALICQQCIIELYQCINFRKKIQNSDEFFKNKLSESQIWKDFDYYTKDEKDEINEESGGDEYEDDIKIESLEEEILSEKLYSENEKDESTIFVEEALNQSQSQDDNIIVVRRRGRKIKDVNSKFKRLTCQYCNISLSRRQRLIQHERLHFSKSYYTCDLCGKNFRQIFALIPHFQKYHNFQLNPIKERWKCSICPDKFLPAEKMNGHYHKMHNEFYSESTLNPFQQQSNSSTHQYKSLGRKRKAESKKKSTNISNKTFAPCSLCGNSFTSSYRYQKHLRDIHGVAESYEILQNDVVEANGDNVENAILPREFLKTQELKQSKKVPCSTCGKVFASITTCKAHEKTHLNIQYICDLCGSVFKVKAYLTAHVQKVHMKIKRFKCSLCPQAFVHRELLNYHVRKHLNIRNYSCSFCQKTFVRKACALIHMRIHKNERPYSCKFCDRTFVHHSDKRRHEATHELRQTNGIPDKN